MTSNSTSPNQPYHQSNWTATYGLVNYVHDKLVLWQPDIHTEAIEVRIP